jgi:HAE1 family hydrophobic/amphiphilic exporter-1
MLGSRFVKAHSQKKHGRLYRVSERAFDAMLGAYDRSLKVTMRHRFITFLVFLASFGASIYLFIITPKGFFPSEDTGQAFGLTEAAQGISFDSLVEHQIAVAKVIEQETNMLNYTSSVGSSGGGSSVSANGGRVFLRLKPRSERKMSADEIIQSLRPKLAQIPGINVYLQNPPLIRVGGSFSKGLYQFTLQGTDASELYHWTPILQSKMAELPGFQDVTSDLLLADPQVTVEIDRDKANALGISAEQIETALNTAYGQTQISTIYTDIDQYWVMMELAPEFQRDPSALSQLYIRSATGKLIPMSAVTRTKRGVGPTTVNHFGQLPAVTISFNLAPGMALGTAVEAVTKLQSELRLPATLTASFQGSAQVFQASLKGLGLLLLVSILVIYIILGVLYESFIHPLTILSGLPSAGFGALLTLMLFHLELDIYGFVGLILLVGIVKKNAIMMIDFAVEAQRKGKPAAEAIYEGCLLRFRPIMMTTMCALMSALPIAIGYGAGGESRRPLGLSVVGGLVVSQLLTLYITPVIYLYLESLSERARKHFGRKHAPSTQATDSSTAPVEA